MTAARRKRGLRAFLARALGKGSSRQHRDLLLADLRVLQLEERRVLSGLPAAMLNADHELVLGAGSRANDGQADTFVLSRDGDQVHASVDGQEVYVGDLADISAIRVEGSADQDTLILDFSGGDPLPAGGIHFDAGSSPSDAADALILACGSFGGTIDTVCYDFQGSGAGSIRVWLAGDLPGDSQASVAYSGIESIHDATRADHLVFRSASGGQDITLRDDGQAGNSVSLLRWGDLQVEFEEPNQSLTLDTTGRPGDRADRVDLQSLDLSHPVHFMVHGDAEDAVFVSGTVALDGASAEVQSGSIRVDGTLAVGGGSVILDAGPEGILTVSGSIDASNLNLGQVGGTVQLSGGRVELLGEARLDARGDAGGGTVLVGGGLTGQDTTISSAWTTYVGPDVVILADAVSSGNGGTVIVWANCRTHFAGSIRATGGSSGGSGGFAEVSGRQVLAFCGFVDLSAPSGAAGRLLLDPDAIDIDAALAATIVHQLSFADVVIEADEINVQAPIDASGAEGNQALILVASTITFEDGADLITHDGDLLLQGDVTLAPGATVLFSTGADAGGHIDIQGNVDGGGLPDGSVSLLAGTGTITVNGAVGSGAPLALTVLECEDATFTAPVSCTTITLAGIHGTVLFEDDVAATALDTSADGYAISFRGLANAIADGATFLNTGGVILGHGGDTTLAADGGTLAFDGPVTLVGNATLSNLAGDIRFFGQVDVRGDVSIEASGSILFESALVSSGGGVHSLNLASDANIDFNGEVGAGPGNALGAITIAAAADVTAGSSIRCGTLVQLAGFGTTTFRGDITTTGAGGLDITADQIVLEWLSITASGDGTVRFGGPVNLAGDVTIDAQAAIIFDGALVSSWGSVHNLTLTSDADIQFNDAVGAGEANQLGAITVVEVADVIALSTIDCASLLQLAGSGSTLLADDVTTSAPEGLVIAASQIVLDGLSITTAGGGIVRFDGPVDLAGDVAIDAAGAITFEQVVVSSGGGSHGLMLTSAADILFADSVGAGPGNALGAITIADAVDVTAHSTLRSASLLQLDGSGTTLLEEDITTTAPEGVDVRTSQIVLDGLTVTTTGEGIVRFDGPVDLTGDAVIHAAGSITFEDTVVSSNDRSQSLGLASDADITFQGPVGSGPGNALGEITISRAVDVEILDTIDAASLLQRAGSGTTTLHGDVTTASFDGFDVTASLIVLDCSTITAIADGSVRFGGPVDLACDVTILAGGSITFDETVVSSDDRSQSLTLASDVHIRFSDSVGAGPGNALGAITITRAYNVEAWASIDAASLVQLNGLGTTTLHGNVTTSFAEGVDLDTASVVLDGLAITAANDGVVRFNASVDLTGHVAVDAGGAIAFESTLISSDGRASSLTLTSQSNIDFNDWVGAIEGNQLGAITILAAADVTARSMIHCASLVQQTGFGTTTLHDDLTTTASDGVDLAADQIVLDGLSITATGGGVARFRGPVDLTGDVAIDAQGTIRFESVLTSSFGGACALTLTTEADVEFRDAVGPSEDEALGAITITTAYDVTACSIVQCASLLQLAGFGTTTLHGDVTTTALEGVDLTASQIVFEGLGPDGLNVVNPNGGRARFNGPVELASDVAVDTSDGDILFTILATVDSRSLENNSLTLTAGMGAVSFNADIGQTEPIGRLVVVQADAGVTFGGSGGADFGPVANVRTEGEIDLGSTAVIDGGITLDAGNGNTIFFTAADRIRFHGAVTLNSDAWIDSSGEGATPGGEIRFTFFALVDSQAGESNALVLTAGTDGIVSFNADIGTGVPLGQLIVTDAKGVAFGNDGAADPDFGFVGTVCVVGDSNPANADVFDIDLGSASPIGDDGITLNAGDGGTLFVLTTSDSVRFNGAVLLESDAWIDTSDWGFEVGAEIRFTQCAFLDSQAGENNDLVLAAGAEGIVSFNADIGAGGPLGQLIVTDAWGVALGNDSNPADPDLGPINMVRVDGDLLDPTAFAIDLGSFSAIGGAEISLNGGDGDTISLVSTADRVRLNGAVMIQSDALIDTTDAGREVGAEIRFTLDAPIDSQADENNDLVLAAGSDGIVLFNANIGAETPLGQLIVTDAKGVAFGGDPGMDWDFAPMDTVRVDGDLDPANPDDFDVNIGRDAPIGDDGILFNAGDGGTFSLLTTSDAVRFCGAVALASDAVISTSVDGVDTVGADILIEGTIDGIAGPIDMNLSLISHAGTTTVTGAVGGLVPLGTLWLQDDQPESTGAVLFLDAVYAASLVTVDRPYDVELLGGGSIADATEFLNTGGVTLGDDADDYLTLGQGVTSTASMTSVGGTVETLDNSILFAAVCVIADARLIAAGDMIQFAGPVDGEPGETNDLELTAPAGKVEFQSDVGAQASLGQLVVTSAFEVVFDLDVAIPSANPTPAHVFNAAGGIDLGRDSEISGGIYLNGGSDGLLLMSTADGMVRLNGPVELQSDVSIDTTLDADDQGELLGAEIRFTLNAPINSQALENNDLILKAGSAGMVSFNADIGTAPDGALGQLIVTDAWGVAFGGDPNAGDPDLGPVGTVLVDGDPADPNAFAVDLGGATAIGAGGITLDAGDGITLFFVTTADSLRFNGALLLASDAWIDTGPTGAEIRFTWNALIDSQFGETNGLTLTAGTDGAVNFNGDIGTREALGHLIVTDAKGVAFGGEQPEEFAPLTTVRVAGDPSNPAAYVIDIGSVAPIGDDGIVLNAGRDLAGDSLTLTVATTGGAVRLNGDVALWSDVVIDTSDSGNWSGADIRFTRYSPVDSQADERNSLILRAGTDGTVSINANVGAAPDGALGQLIVTDAWGVAFGNDTTAADDDLGPLDTVRVGGDPRNPAAFAVNIGSSSAIGSGGIALDAGDGSTLWMLTTADRVRFNGAVELQSDVQIDTTDLGAAVGAEVVFTRAAPIDSQVGEYNGLTVTAGEGSLEFNADLGRQQPLKYLDIVSADGGVVFGASDQLDSAGDRGPVGTLRTQDGIDVGSGAVISGGIVVNAGPGQEFSMQVENGDVRLNGPTRLFSDLSVDTSPGNGDVLFTMNATIDSQADEHNNLRLNAGTGAAYFNANVGAAGGVDARIGFLRVETSDKIEMACHSVQAIGEIVLISSGDVTIHEVPPGFSTLSGASFTVSAGGLLTIESGAAVASATGQVSNAPPIFRPDPDDPNRVLVPGDRVQTITGTIGGDGRPGDNLERGVNFTLTVFWSDGLTTVIPNLHAGDRLTIFVDESGHGVPVITHGTDTGPIQFSLSRQYSLAYLQTVSTAVETWMVLSNDPRVRLDDMRAISLNEASAVASVKVASDLFRYSEGPPKYEPPAGIGTLERVAAAPAVRTAPPEVVTRYESLPTGSDVTVENVRMVYLVRVYSNGREGPPYPLPENALANLSALFEQFKAEGLPNGRYRIYLKEPGFPPRLVIEFYKSGDSFGDPVRERGPGSNPLTPEKPPPAPAPNQGSASPGATPQSATLGVRLGGGELLVLRLCEEMPAMQTPIPGGARCGADGAPAGVSRERISSDRDGAEAVGLQGDLARIGEPFGRVTRPLTAAAVLALAEKAPAAHAWAHRIDEALENSPRRALGRLARLSRRISE